MSNLYIVLTRYQLLITLAKLDFNDKNTLILLDDILSESEKNILFENKIFEKIEITDDYYFTITREFFQNWKKRADFIGLVRRFDNIYIFDDHFYIGHYLNKYKIKYCAIEDALNYYLFNHRNFKDFVFTKNSKMHHYKQLLNHLIYSKANKPGYGKYCQSIEVNDISVVPKDERYHKFKEVPRKDLFNNISEERKKLILRVFGVEELSGVTDKSVLILTQPLSIDGLMNSDDKQYGFYEKICDKYLSEGYEVYLKPHPRDTITYEKINGVNLIAQSVPMELIEMVSNVKFERIITHSSTAINFLTCGKEKEVFFDFNTREYDEELLEKYKINKDEL